MKSTMAAIHYLKKVLIGAFELISIVIGGYRHQSELHVTFTTHVTQ